MCLHCGAKQTRKNGKVNGRQRFQCVACGRQFLGGNRLSNDDLWQSYVRGKQTYKQLAQQHGVSPRTIQRRLDKARVQGPPVRPRPAVIVMDTTYFGRGFGLLVLHDAWEGRPAWHTYVKNETIRDYKTGLEWLAGQGFEVKAAVCDGKRGLMTGLAPLPVQMCQFHQIAIVTRYLTRNPRHEASQELRAIALRLHKLKRAEFVALLDGWLGRWQAFLDERATDPKSGKSHYRHKNLRSAWNSLRRNLPWLFTFEDFPELRIPNTTNMLDGSFSDLKNKLRNHNRLSKARRMKFMDEHLAGSHRGGEA